MKIYPKRIRLTFTAGLAMWSVVAIGCASSGIRPGGPRPTAAAPAPGFSPGLSGPGAGSADARGTGAIAPGEGAGLTGPTALPAGNSAAGAGGR